MTDSEKLINILNNLCHGAYTGKYNLEDAYSEVLDLFKSMLPEEKPESEYETDYEFWERKYWNDCRSQLLAKIEGMRKS